MLSGEGLQGCWEMQRYGDEQIVPEQFGDSLWLFPSRMLHLGVDPTLFSRDTRGLTRRSSTVMVMVLVEDAVVVGYPLNMR